MSTIKNTLKHGLKVGEATYKDYEIREATTADLFAAEEHAPVSKRLTFKAAMLGQQLVRLGELSGPIDLKVLGKLHPADFDQLCEDMDKADKQGNAEPGG
ncbi:phage tail assembly protein [Frateuria sp. YIM B11624]|uniref:phage tail assembly protein n=1 Tax=Frateuria sp. YIM B11624 TaxID=3143185 RepID=UPI003C76EC2F